MSMSKVKKLVEDLKKSVAGLDLCEGAPSATDLTKLRAGFLDKTLKLAALVESMVVIVERINDYDMQGKERRSFWGDEIMGPGYPFSLSFDEVSSQIAGWHEGMEKRMKDESQVPDGDELK